MISKQAIDGVVEELIVTFNNEDIPLRISVSHEFQKRSMERDIDLQEVLPIVTSILPKTIFDYVQRQSFLFTLPFSERASYASTHNNDLSCILQAPNKGINVIGVVRWDEIKHDGLVFLIVTAVRKDTRSFYYDEGDILYIVK